MPSKITLTKTPEYPVPNNRPTLVKVEEITEEKKTESSADNKKREIKRDEEETEHVMNHNRWWPWFCTVNEQEKFTGISREKIIMMKESGQLPYIMRGNRVMVAMDLLKAQLEAEALAQVTVPGLEGKSVLPNG